MQSARLLILLLLSTCVGCVSAWKPSANPVPWAAAGRLAVSQTRTVYRPFFVIAAPDAVTAERWLDAKHQSHNPQFLVWDAQKYLDAVGATRAWPTTNRYNNHVEERVAPFDFTVASVDPAIIVMTGRADRGPRLGSDQPYAPGDFIGSYLLNFFHTGTSAPFSETVKWFSADLDQPPADAEKTAPDRRIIRWRKGALELQRDGDVWRIERK